MAKLLDIGCGWEEELWFPGADLCDGVLEELKEKVDTGDRKVFAQYIEQSNPHLPIEDEEYDFIWSGSMFDFLGDIDRRVVIDEIYRLLKKNGRAIIRDMEYVEGEEECLKFDIHDFIGKLQSLFPEDRWFSYIYYNVEKDETPSMGILYLIHLQKT